MVSVWWVTLLRGVGVSVTLELVNGVDDASDKLFVSVVTLASSVVLTSTLVLDGTGDAVVVSQGVPEVDTPRLALAMVDFGEEYVSDTEVGNIWLSDGEYDGGRAESVLLEGCSVKLDDGIP